MRAVLCLLCMATSYCNAQVINTYNLTINNGLPSNHVYSTITDKFGYLWMATTNGVVRYNGYEPKVYNTFEGMANNDVWRLQEDRDGKIWLGSIGDAVGYMQNGIYHIAYVRAPRFKFYPMTMVPFGNGILFDSWGDFYSGRTVCVSTRNTIQVLPYSLFKGSCRMNEHGDIVVIRPDSIYYIRMRLPMNYSVKRWAVNTTRQPGAKYEVLSHYLLFYNVNGSIIFVRNLLTNKLTQLQFGNEDKREHILLAYSVEGYLYVMGNKHIYVLDSTFRVLKKISINAITNERGATGCIASYLMSNNFWGTVLSSNAGAFINTKYQPRFKKIKSVHLENFAYMGSSGTGFWWDQLTNRLLALRDTLLLFEKKADIPPVHSVKLLSTDTALILATNKMFSVNGNGEIKPFELTSLPGLKSLIDITRIDRDNYYALSDNIYGLWHVNSKSDTVDKYDENYRYINLAYDGLHKRVWAYAATRILIHSDKENYIIPKEQLALLGIKNLKQIGIDGKYGNVFVRDMNGMYLFDGRHPILRPLFQNFNLKDANMYLRNGVLIVSGPFGLLFSKIHGNGMLSSPVLYDNEKSQVYSYIEDCQVSDSGALLKTDAGIFYAGFPTEREFSEAREVVYKYRFVVGCNNVLYDGLKGDTLQLNQKNEKLLFDIVNPKGTGHLSFQYRMQGIDSMWHNMEGNELLLPGLKADNYYLVKLKASDKMWQSGVLYVPVYVVPLWWQTKAGERGLFMAGLLTLGLLIFLAVILTKYQVTKKNRERYQRVQLELKSVYAQINPHFIFNTLNLALLYIEKKDMETAYTHISKFSKLLRAYIKSARNKFIKVDEEIKNLGNYIELQQARFKNRFEYTIQADEGVGQRDIPSLLLQPFVENAINHGLLHKDTIGRLWIRFENGVSENELICTVEDDGVGRERARKVNAEMQPMHESYGGELVADLIEMFNKHERIKIRLHYIDKKYPDTGTKVIINIVYE